MNQLQVLHIPSKLLAIWTVSKYTLHFKTIFLQMLVYTSVFQSGFTSLHSH